MKFDPKIVSIVAGVLFFSLSQAACTKHDQHTHERQYQQIGHQLDKAEQNAQEKALRAQATTEAARQAYENALQAQAEAEAARDQVKEEKENAKQKAREIVEQMQ